MSRDLYRYTFAAEVKFDEVEVSLILAIFGVESLHGESQVRLDVAHCIDCDRRACVIDASTQAGRDLNRLFVGYLRREFPDSFRVEHLTSAESPQAAEVAA